MCLNLYATACARDRARRGERYPAVSADQRTGQTGRSVRREISNHRFRVEQLYQFGDLFHLRADAVQEPVAAAAPFGGLAVRGAAEEPVRDSGAGADAGPGRDVVPGDRRRDLSE